MKYGNVISEDSELESLLENKDAHKRLLNFFEVLIQINNREKLVKNYNEDNRRNTGNTSKSK